MGINRRHLARACVPTHAFELIEAAAVRRGLVEGHIEGRNPLAKPLDVLVQHLVTIGLGGGFAAEELLAEVRTAYASPESDRQRVALGA